MKYSDERLLIEGLKAGTEDAYICLVDRYSRRLFGYSLTLANDHAMAEDILQNVFLRTWEKRRKLNVTTSLQNYLFRSIHNEFINQYKKRQSNLLLEQKYYENLEKAARTEDYSRLEKLIVLVIREIEKLPPKCQEVFNLSRREGLTNLEISNHLNISVKTVEAQITKAFGILRKNLGEKYSGILVLILGKRLKLPLN
ncbi:MULTISPECIES: RNA polymerase sigma factor [Flavobacteriaceae]|jgi:RNA polymerase sigma-70 factor (ECF subfamily)|uniref:RNA polymerase sigma-70 factor n=3 Tax=Flavobacteriaceae TaxID=49546 RepID=A0ABU7IXD8_9FLAO|nr:MULTISPECIES: RNA polymerase sigma-70 factor [Flavobacteriaceae]MAO15462.1 RNA polymerase sigma-70 factor [Allomuricauda sp.]MBW8244989.1 RNA polymerase sigma-70 factor [Allomuricauda oceani]MDC6390255.1 RNA polymerase sigma-70 factor [Maribacter sp. PR1]MEE1977645.1 RNA polymerase sigma-70 factor [Maribacter cobaltidurans]NDV43510.1 RNA polymerase sigma-70 factor [Allomuricauda sediminis]|tara:strand:- start:104 stop:697 length:594 start_codon:yes stop_codon:yes gene_type:complete